MEGRTLWRTLELEGRYLRYISGVVSRKTKRTTNTKENAILNSVDEFWMQKK
jgi:hypothetical protein